MATKLDKKPETNTQLTETFSAFDSLGGAIAPVEQGVSGSYIALYHDRSKETAIKIRTAFPAVESYDPFLIDGNRVEKLSNPFDIHFLKLDQFFVKTDVAGNIVQAWRTFDNVPAGTDKVERLVEAIVVLYHNGKCHLTRISLKKARANLVDDFQAVYQLACNNELWPTISELHKPTVSIPNPKFRFYMESKVRVRVSQGNGQEYPIINGIGRPVSKGHFIMLTELTHSPSFKQTLAIVDKQYQDRIQTIEGKIVHPVKQVS